MSQKAGWDMYGQKIVKGDMGTLSIPFGDARHGKEVAMVSEPFNENSTLRFTVREWVSRAEYSVPAQNIIRY